MRMTRNVLPQIAQHPVNASQPWRLEAEDEGGAVVAVMAEECTRGRVREPVGGRSAEVYHDVPEPPELPCRPPPEEKAMRHPVTL